MYNIVVVDVWLLILPILAKLITIKICRYGLYRSVLKMFLLNASNVEIRKKNS